LEERNFGCGMGTEIPELFDEDDRRLAETQGPLGLHFYEWLAAIVLHHATGYLSLVSKYEFAKHRRKQEIVEKLLPADILPMLRDRIEHGRAQPPDLLMFAPDLSDWFFCEVKGPGDRLKPEQLKKFEALATKTAKPVRLLRLKWARTGSEGASSSPRSSA
jgi:VRR-NUC domain